VDIRIAASEAKMGFNFTKLGIHPGMGASHFLPKLIGYQKASELLLAKLLLEKMLLVLA